MRMVSVAQQVLTAVLIPLLGCGLPYPESSVREPGYDLLFEPFATRAPDGSLYIGSLFRAMFTEFPRSAPQPQTTEGPDDLFDRWGTGDHAHHFHQRRNVVCCFLSGHFLPKGEELPGSARDSVLFGVLAGEEDRGPDVSQEGSWKIKNKQESVWGSLELEMMLESLDGPARDSLGDRWQTKKALQVDMAGPLFAFGEFNAGYNTISAQEMKMSGGSGIGVKFAAWENGEASLKGGSQVNYTQDPLRPAISQNDKSRLLLELACQYAIVGPLRLEYSGSAAPAMSPLEGNRISQDVRLLLPLGSNGQFRLGAKRNWSDQPAFRATPDANQIYLGVGLSR
jgi:hypothetical protein